jgi:uncharacterized protein YbcC (UPF0753/DUF2309 family)
MANSMWISILKYLVFLLLGMAIGFYALGEYTRPESPVIEKSPPAQARATVEPRVVEQLADVADDQYLETIRGKDEEIANLKAELARMKTLAETTAVRSSDNEAMQTMSVEEMAATVGESLRNQFKNRVLTMPEEQMEEFKQSFYDESYSEWGMEYQENILDFFATTDNADQYYLQSVECKTKSCRLEVNTENTPGWREFYFSMTHQDWYDSFTLQEESDYPGTQIYYLVRDEDGGG